MQLEFSFCLGSLLLVNLSLKGGGRGEGLGDFRGDPMVFEGERREGNFSRHQHSMKGGGYRILTVN